MFLPFSPTPPPYLPLYNGHLFYKGLTISVEFPLLGIPNSPILSLVVLCLFSFYYLMEDESLPSPSFRTPDQVRIQEPEVLVETLRSELHLQQVRIDSQP